MGSSSFAIGFLLSGINNMEMKVLGRLNVSVLIMLILTGCALYLGAPARESFIKGVEYAGLGKFKEAKDSFDKALKHDPFYKSAQCALKTVEDVIEGKIKSESAVHLFK